MKELIKTVGLVVISGLGALGILFLCQLAGYVNSYPAVKVGGYTADSYVPENNSK